MITDRMIEAALACVFGEDTGDIDVVYAKHGKRATLRNAMRAALAAADAAAWEPMETAPCDDTLAVVMFKDGNMQVCDLDHDSDPEWWAERGATHWRPLPTPPEQTP